MIVLQGVIMFVDIYEFRCLIKAKKGELIFISLLISMIFFIILGAN